MDADTVKAVIVDDHKDVVDVLSEYIEMNQPKVKVVGKGSNGLEAVRLYEEHRPDVMFLDINMPLYDGLYAIEHIRKINPSARIVVISNSISDEIKFQLKNASIPIIDKSSELAKIQEYLEKLTITLCHP